MPYQFQPLGTIIASVMQFDQLCFLLGEESLPDHKKTYAPCDGRNIQLSQLSGFTTPTSMLRTPDLRGKFLRGLNSIYAPGETPFENWREEGDPDGNGRVVCSSQSDDFKNHTHTYNYFHNSIVGDYSDDQDHRKASFGDSYDVQTGEKGGSETRPRNVAVYYYIKINS